jgi:DNA primase
MEIHELKTRLSITEVAQKLGIQINRQGRANCPFHNDKTPSLQFSKEKNICTCFSTNCTAGTMDIISLTEKYKNITTHEALKYLSEIVGESEASRTPSKNNQLGEQLKVKPINNKPTTIMNYPTDFEQMQSSFISSSTARNYAESRNLNWKALQIGYNAFKASRFNYLRGCITFALRNKRNNVVSMYGRSVRDNASTGSAQGKAKHYYTANRKGLYPGYPLTRLNLAGCVIIRI